MLAKHIWSDSHFYAYLVSFYVKEKKIIVHIQHYNLQHVVNDCIKTALNYYNKSNTDYSISIILNEGYGDNKFYYCADFLDDLLIPFSDLHF